MRSKKLLLDREFLGTQHKPKGSARAFVMDKSMPRISCTLVERYEFRKTEVECQ